MLVDGGTRPIVPPEEPAEPQLAPERPADALVGTNVFVLFDTSNYMYRGFVYASDAIADFIRGLARGDSVAVYTFSRNMSRASLLTPDRVQAIQGLRKAVAGDDSALYNAMLLALRDAAKVPGRKVLIVFSNGPDNEVNSDPISSSVFQRLTNRTGGKAYFARTWQRQVEAFESIREDLGNAYTITYYPAANPNEGFRKIGVEIVSDVAKKYRVRARPGYRPRPGA